MRGFTKGLIVGLTAITLFGATATPARQWATKKESPKKTEYQISTCAYQDESGNIWVFETMINKTNGNLEYRKQVHSKKYKNIK